MTLEERKQILLNHSANEVRNSRTLFAEFVFIYTAEGGNKRDCMSCNFKRVFNSWKSNQSTTVIKKTEVMSNNTFKLKNPTELIQIPLGLGTITKDSPDEMVLTFLNQDGGKHKAARIERFFLEVPKEKKKRKPRAKKEVKEEVKEQDLTVAKALSKKED